MSGVCNRTSNNKYFKCPPIMSDGRHFTDYRPNTYANDLVRYGNNVMSSNAYRQFLINNASNLMNVNSIYAEKKNSCTECNATPIPTETKCIVNQSYSTCYPDSYNGLGLRNLSEFLPSKDYSRELQHKY